MNLLDNINFEVELLKLKKESNDIPGLLGVVEGFLSTYNRLNPLTVAKAFLNSTEKLSYDPNINTLRENLLAEYKKNIFSYELESAQFEIKKYNSPFYNQIVSEIQNILDLNNEDNIRISIKENLSSHVYIPQIKNLVHFINKHDNELNSTAEHYSKPVYSPIFVTEKGNLIFNLLGNNIALNESGTDVIGSITIEDKIYNDLVEAVNTFTFTQNDMIYYKNDSKLILSESNNKLELKVNGTSIDLNENWKKTLLLTKVFDINSMRELNLLESVIKNYNSIIKLDNVKQLHLRNFNNKKVNVLTLENKIAVHKVDTDIKINSIDIFETASSAIKNVKEFIGYDLSESLNSYLKVEKEQLEILKEERIKLIEKIEFLNLEKSNLNNSTFNKNEKVSKLIEFMDNELLNFTEKLKNITSNINNLSEKNNPYENQGFIEGKFKKDIPSNLSKYISKNENIYIFAEDYTTSGAKEDIIIKTSSGKEFKVKKETVSPVS